MPRFAYEDHLARADSGRSPLAGLDPPISPAAPDASSSRAPQALDRPAGLRTLHLDIVDYPGEWLLDLPLLDKTYAEWSRETLRRERRSPARAPLAEQWRAARSALDPAADADETRPAALAELSPPISRAARDDVYALSTLPPGRFLMPGDLEGSPALTFAPLAAGDDAASRSRIARGDDGAPLRGL